MGSLIDYPGQEPQDPAEVEAVHMSGFAQRMVRERAEAEDLQSQLQVAAMQAKLNGSVLCLTSGEGDVVTLGAHSNNDVCVDPSSMSRSGDSLNTLLNAMVQSFDESIEEISLTELSVDHRKEDPEKEDSVGRRILPCVDFEAIVEKAKTVFDLNQLSAADSEEMFPKFVSLKLRRGDRLSVIPDESGTLEEHLHAMALEAGADLMIEGTYDPRVVTPYEKALCQSVEGSQPQARLRDAIAHEIDQTQSPQPQSLVEAAFLSQGGFELAPVSSHEFKNLKEGDVCVIVHLDQDFEGKQGALGLDEYLPLNALKVIPVIIGKVIPVIIGEEGWTEDAILTHPTADSVKYRQSELHNMELLLNNKGKLVAVESFRFKNGEVSYSELIGGGILQVDEIINPKIIDGKGVGDTWIFRVEAKQLPLSVK